MDKLINFIKRNKKFSLIVLSFLVIILVLLIFLFKDDNNPILNKEEITISLFGSDNITLNYGEEYIEPGFYAVSSLGEIKTNEVIVDNNININEPGIYKVTYKIDDKVLERIVEVLEDYNSTLYLSLLGNNNITLSLGEEYIEPGYLAKNKKGENLNDKVIVSGEVNTEVEGIYTITYTLEIGDVKKEVTRTITVINKNLEISYNLDKTSYTKSNVSIKISIAGNYFSYLILPNKVVSYDKNIEYNISNNGTYKFLAYNEDGEEFEKIIEVSNIDKKAPTGSCTATLYYKNTNIEVNANDEVSGIKNYVYLNDSKVIRNTTDKLVNYNEKLSKNIRVKVYDNALNEMVLTCNIIDKSYLEPIKPNESENVVKKDETDTLKVYITKNSSYYITRIWAYDPYNQLNKFDSPEYGKKLYRPKALLGKARDKYNLSNKLIIGFNASGFYLRDTYDASSVSKYSSYDKTSVGTLVITNGNVVRNWYNHAYKTWFITGIDKDNNLRIFRDQSGTSSDQKENKKKWADDVINTGIRNTFTFASPLVENGVKSSIKTNMPSPNENLNRQAICQVNRNNFVLITGKELNRNDLINIMLKLNCQTGMNLDGGGSIALLYKDKNETNIQTIIGNGRNLTEVGYFTE